MDGRGIAQAMLSLDQCPPRVAEQQLFLLQQSNSFGYAARQD